MVVESEPSLSLPLKIKLKCFIVSAMIDYVLRPDGTVNRRLLRLLDRPVPSKPTPQHGVSSHDIVVDPSRDLWFRLFLPTQCQSPGNTSAKLPVIVFFHGGGFAVFNPATADYDAVCHRFAQELDAVVISVNYRLTPEHKFPAQYEDGFDVLKFIDKNRKKITVWPEDADLQRCFLAGDSAGANIVHNVGVKICSGNWRFRDMKVIGLIVIQPFFGGKEQTGSEIKYDGIPIKSRFDWSWKAFLPDRLNRDHWAVDVSGPNALDVRGIELPPVILFTGRFDPLRDRQLRYHDWLRRSGKEVVLVDIATACHSFFLFPEIPESKKLIEEVRSFIVKPSSRS
ncbi:hypothetical protein Drorol1_Dr00005368 [Drosera rotundifolia]